MTMNLEENKIEELKLINNSMKYFKIIFISLIISNACLGQTNSIFEEKFNLSLRKLDNSKVLNVSIYWGDDIKSLNLRDSFNLDFEESKIVHYFGVSGQEGLSYCEYKIHYNYCCEQLRCIGMQSGFFDGFILKKKTIIYSKSTIAEIILESSEGEIRRYKYDYENGLPSKVSLYSNGQEEKIYLISYTYSK